MQVSYPDYVGEQNIAAAYRLTLEIWAHCLESSINPQNQMVNSTMSRVNKEMKMLIAFEQNEIYPKLISKALPSLKRRGRKGVVSTIYLTIRTND